MATFMATFGVQYKTVPHPSGLDANPDGYVRIEAPNYDLAVEAMQAVYGVEYAFIYREEDFAYEYHPDGVINEISVMGSA